jgi:hypothetical protein
MIPVCRLTKKVKKYKWSAVFKIPKGSMKKASPDTKERALVITTFGERVMSRSKTCMKKASPDTKERGDYHLRRKGNVEKQN